MDALTIHKDLLERVRTTTIEVCDGLDDTTARRRIAPGTNTICWLLWHIGRCIDAQVHEALGGVQLWQEWAERLHLPLPDDRLGLGATGYQQDPDDVIHVVADVDDLRDYVLACCDDMAAVLSGPIDLERVIDESWDPPVTVAVRLTSILVDCLEHLGQAGFLRGVIERTQP